MPAKSTTNSLNVPRMIRSLLLALFFLPFTAAAQFGVSYQYQLHQTAAWSAALAEALGRNNVDFLPNGHRYEVDYWLKVLPENRLEIMPALTYATADYTLDRDRWQLRSYGAALNINLYPLDWAGDCDCPVWSKSEPVFKKGFFLQLSPGWRSTTFEHDRTVGNQTTTAGGKQQNGYLGAGAGLDIGLSDLITLSPLVRYVHVFDAAWPGLVGPAEEPATVDGNFSQWEFGVRLGIRLDQ